MRYLHTMVRVADLDKALDFYCNKFGLVEMRRAETKPVAIPSFSLLLPAIPNRHRQAGHPYLN